MGTFTKRGALWIGAALAAVPALAGPALTPLSIRLEMHGGGHPPSAEALLARCEPREAECRLTLRHPVVLSPRSEGRDAAVGVFETKVARAELEAAIARWPAELATLQPSKSILFDSVVHSVELQRGEEKPARGGWATPDAALMKSASYRAKVELFSEPWNRWRAAALKHPVRAARLSCQNRSRGHELKLSCAILNMGSQPFRLASFTTDRAQVLSLSSFEPLALTGLEIGAELPVVLKPGARAPLELTGTSPEAALLRRHVRLRLDLLTSERAPAADQFQGWLESNGTAAK